MPDPAIKHEGGDVWKRGESRNAVVSIEDSIRVVLQHEDDRGRDTSALRAMLSEEKIFAAAAREVGENIVVAAEVARRKAVDGLLGNWMEANAREGHYTDFPVELSNIFDVMLVEEAEPIRRVFVAVH